jgi:hypothetical protein
VDGASRTSYFQDVVIELAKTEDGGSLVSFEKSARRFAIPASEKTFLAAARASLTNGAPVHVAVEEPAELAQPSPFDGGAAPKLVWLDRTRQHASCAK